MAVCGMATPPSLSGWASPGVTGTPGVPREVPVSCPVLMTVAASLAARPAAVAWVRACNSGAEIRPGELSAAAPRITSSVMRTAPAVIAT
jgi:hypothetical protein